MFQFITMEHILEPYEVEIQSRNTNFVVPSFLEFRSSRLDLSLCPSVTAPHPETI